MKTAKLHLSNHEDAILDSMLTHFSQ
uniref:Uncharacterized protein n=1 Tax=Arundo donax TaxID=35708 RepID=A0A0A9FKG0_ARUDO